MALRRGTEGGGGKRNNKMRRGVEKPVEDEYKNIVSPTARNLKCKTQQFEPPVQFRPPLALSLPASLLCPLAPYLRISASTGILSRCQYPSWGWSGGRGTEGVHRVSAVWLRRRFPLPPHPFAQQPPNPNPHFPTDFSHLRPDALASTGGGGAQDMHAKF